MKTSKFQWTGELGHLWTFQSVRKCPFQCLTICGRLTGMSETTSWITSGPPMVAAAEGRIWIDGNVYGVAHAVALRNL